jgi:hypothetical protein
MGTVYLLLEVDSNSTVYHKIGTTRNGVEKRIKQLQTGNSKKISLLNKYDSEHYKKIEIMLHNKYKFQKTEPKNEWFELTDEQVLSFLDTCKKLEENIVFMMQNNHFWH